MSYFGIINNISNTGAINGVGQSIGVNIAGHNSAGMVLTGVRSGQIRVEGSMDGGITYTNLWFGGISTLSAFSGMPDIVTSTQKNGTYSILNTAGITNIRAISTQWTSGSANVYIGAVAAAQEFSFSKSEIIQSVFADPNNSSTDNIGAGSAYVGSASLTTGVNSIQISFKADQNCMIYVEQSPDGTNWDIVDSYEYIANYDSFGITVQAVNSYYRTRVVNVGLSTTIYFNLQSVLCPVADPLPRSLDSRGYLQVATKNSSDHYGYEAEYTTHGEQRVVEPVRLVGASFGGDIDPNFWTANVGGGATAYVNGSQLTMATLNGVGATALVQSFRAARYVGRSSNRFRALVRIPDSGITSSVCRWGAYNGTDGAFFTLDNRILGCVTMKAGTATTVSSGNFNGTLGTSYNLADRLNTYEIYYTNKKVTFVMNDDILHEVVGLTTTWTDTLTLPVRLECSNYVGAATTAAMNIRTAAIARLGKIETAPIYKFFNAATNLRLKNTAGRLHTIIVGAYSNGATLAVYDSPTTSANQIMGATLSNTGVGPIIFTLDLDFYNGLNVTVTNITACTVIYE